MGGGTIKVIRLERSVGDVNEYARMLYTSLMSLEDCNWVQVPRMAVAYVKEALRLKGLVDAVPSQPPERLCRISALMPGVRRPLCCTLRSAPIAAPYRCAQYAACGGGRLSRRRLSSAVDRGS
jgi:hypothetical protein